MTQSVEAFGMGEAEVTLPVEATDEIGVLARAFAGLIEQVEERTTALATEVAEHKRDEEARRQSEGRFRDFMNNSPAIAFMKDEAGRYVYYNEPFTRFFNSTDDELYGKTDFDLWPVETAHQLRQNDLSVLNSEKTVQGRETTPTQEGEILWLSYKFPITDAAGQKFLGCVAIDITEQNRAQEELNRLFTLVPDMLCIAGTDGYFRRLNPAFEKTPGYSQEELMKKPFLEFIHPQAGRPLAG